MATSMLLAMATVAADDGDGERFQATILDMGGDNVAFRTAQRVSFEVERYSTDAEVTALAKVLAEGGPEVLREAVRDANRGWFRVGNSVGYPVALASSIRGANGRTVRLLIDRPIDFFPGANSRQPTDYPFAVVEVHLDAAGKGEGQLIGAAAVSLAGNTIQVERSASVPFRLLNVRARPR
jgi:hypothetical protein